MRLTIITTLAVFGITACATASRFTIENRLEDLGLSRDMAECMADGLDDRLNDDELAEFARFTVTVSKRKDLGPMAVVQSLSDISNPRIAKAVLATGLACVI